MWCHYTNRSYSIVDPVKIFGQILKHHERANDVKSVQRPGPYETRIQIDYFEISCNSLPFHFICLMFWNEIIVIALYKLLRSFFVLFLLLKDLLLNRLFVEIMFLQSVSSILFVQLISVCCIFSKWLCRI